MKPAIAAAVLILAACSKPASEGPKPAVATPEAEAPLKPSNETYRFADIPWGTPVEKAKEILTAKVYRVKAEIPPKTGPFDTELGKVVLDGKLADQEAEVWVHYAPNTGVVQIDVWFTPKVSVAKTFESLRDMLIRRYGPHQNFRLNPEDDPERIHWPRAKDPSYLSLARVRDSRGNEGVVVTYYDMLASALALNEISGEPVSDL